MISNCLKKLRRVAALAVISAIVLSQTSAVNAQQEVLGETTTFSEDQKALLYAKPAVVQITNIVSGKLIMQSAIATQLNAPQLTGKTYQFVTGFTGSGFFLSSDGYLVTNGHVVKPEDDLVAYYALSLKAEEIMKDALRYAIISNYGYTPTSEDLEEMYLSVLNSSYGGSYEEMVWDLYETDYKGGNIKMDSVKNNNYIQTGAVSGSQKLVQEYGRAATLVDTSYAGDFDSKDLALLKVEGTNFPTIDLGSFTNVQIGTEVYVIGYPGIVEVATGIFTDVESGLEPTITKGIISAKKKLVDGTEAFQTDAGISGGNSGGPVVDNNGKVIGVATWSISPQGEDNYNFLISVEQVNNLLNKNNVTSSESITTTKWKEALDAYSDKCYTKAKGLFEDTKTLYSDNVDIDDFITKSQTAIENGEDECVTNIETWMYVVGALCCLGVFGGGVVVLFVFVIAKKKKSKTKETKE